ncbi:MAG: hypothetical protein DRJ38_04025 [Thermoprotei archaeon]|nr:MAG: hypothetical protein DRJ38_04025 [Thermoprotei archaeon]
MKSKVVCTYLSLFILIILAINTLTLPNANKLPFFDYEVDGFNGWWETGSGNTYKVVTRQFSSATGNSGYFEIAVLVYIKPPCQLYEYLANTYPSDLRVLHKIYYDFPSEGFYIIYLAHYYTNARASYFAIYDENLNKIYETTGATLDSNPGTGNQMDLYFNNTNHWVALKWYEKTLASGETPDYSIITKLYQWINASTITHKIVRIISDTSPVSVKIYNSTNAEIYAQTFNAGETSYVFINDTKIGIFANGPAGNLYKEFTENGLIIVKLNDTLTDIYLNYSSGITYNVTVYVKDPETDELITADYIRVYAENGTLLGEETNVASAVFSLEAGSYRFEAKKGPVTTAIDKSISDNDEVVLYLGYIESTGCWLYVTAQDPDGNSVSGANVMLSNSTWTDTDTTPANFTVACGTYELEVSKEGYYTFETMIDVNGPTIYTAPLIPVSSDGNNTGWDWWSWIQSWIGNWTPPGNWSDIWSRIQSWFQDLWSQAEETIGDPVQWFLDQIGLGWLKDYWWLVLLLGIIIIILLAKE